MKQRILLSTVLILAAYILSKSVIKESLFQSPASETLQKCIPPEFDSNYSRDAEIRITPSPDSTIIPVGWEIISTIPESMQGIYATIELVRPQSEYDEIWFFVYADNDIHADVKDYRPINYLIYRTDTKQWRQAPPPPSDWKLVLDPNNNVWSPSVYESGPQLYRLDEFANSFVPIVDKNNELAKWGIKNSVKVAPNGLFWIVLQGPNWENNLLMSFDPVTLETTLHLEGMDIYDVTIDKAGNIYLLHTNDEPFVSMEYISPYTLTKYDPVTGRTDSVEIPLTEDEYGGYTNLYVDRENRLWVSDIAWIDITGSEIGERHFIPRSPIFVHYVNYLTQYVWSRPRINLESIDGRLWYEFEQGAVWYKPDKKEWCWFARGLTSGPIEDSEHNLWMMVDSTLYKLQMTP